MHMILCLRKKKKRFVVCSESKFVFVCVCVFGLFFVFSPRMLLQTQRVLQREREGQSSWRLPEAAREAAAGGGSEGLPGLDHSG